MADDWDQDDDSLYDRKIKVLMIGDSGKLKILFLVRSGRSEKKKTTISALTFHISTHGRRTHIRCWKNMSCSSIHI